MARTAPGLLLAFIATSACTDGAPAVVGVAHGALIPDSVQTLAVTVVEADGTSPVRCEADGTVADATTGQRAASTADLFDQPWTDGLELVGPAELSRGEAEGAVVDGVRPGSVLIFAEGFDAAGLTVARACGGPILVRAHGVTEVALYFVTL